MTCHRTWRRIPAFGGPGGENPPRDAITAAAAAAVFAQLALC